MSAAIAAKPWNGKLISAPGLYRDVPMADYHGQLTVGPSLSSSGARTIFDASPAHYFAMSYLNSARTEGVDSEAFILGRAAHHLLLGEADFGKSYAIRPEEIDGKPWHGNRNECKAWASATAAKGLTVLTPDQAAAIKGMSASLANHQLVGAGILNGLIEHSMVYKDEETGVWIKARPDVIPTDDADFSDLKTAVSVDGDALARAIGQFGYHVQAAMIGMACRGVLGQEMESFTLVFVEKTQPFCVRVVTLKPTDIELGERIVRHALRIFADCLNSGVWPGPGGIQTDSEFIEIPNWSRMRAENMLAAAPAQPEEDTAA